MKMRASLARSLTLDPELFLFDEPFGALDEITRERLNDELLRLFAERRFAGPVHHSLRFRGRLPVHEGGGHVGPARSIVRTFDVPFPMPRDPDIRFTPEFAALVGEVSHALRGGAHTDVSHDQPGGGPRSRRIRASHQAINARCSGTRAPEATWVPPALVFLVFWGSGTPSATWCWTTKRRFLMPPPDQVVTRASWPRMSSARSWQAWANRRRRPRRSRCSDRHRDGVGDRNVTGQVDRTLTVSLRRDPAVHPHPRPGAPDRILVRLRFLLPGSRLRHDRAVPHRLEHPVRLNRRTAPSCELFRLQNASRWTVLAKLQLPAALPAVFAGMRISAGLAVVGAIVGDFFFRRGTPGIGSLISNYQSRVESAELFAAIITASLFGVVDLLALRLDRQARGRSLVRRRRPLRPHLATQDVSPCTLHPPHSGSSPHSRRHMQRPTPRTSARAIVLSGVAALTALTLSACGASNADRRRRKRGRPSNRLGRPEGRRLPGQRRIQTDWNPEAEHGHLYQLLGPSHTSTPTNKSVSGPLYASGQSTGVNVEVRSGGPAIGFQSVAAQMYQDPAITLGYVYTDEAVQLSATMPDKGGVRSAGRSTPR